MFNVEADIPTSWRLCPLLTKSGHRPVAQQPVALPDVIPSHPHSGRWCTRKVFTFTPLRTSVMFMLGCSLRAIVMQFLTYFWLAGHLIFLPFAGTTNNYGSQKAGT
jgi:hypothetical protein